MTYAPHTQLADNVVLQNEVDQSEQRRNLQNRTEKTNGKYIEWKHQKGISIT